MTHSERIGLLVDQYVEGQIAPFSLECERLSLALAAVENDLEVAEATLLTERAEADRQVESLNATVDALTATVAELRARIAALEAAADPGILPVWGAPVWRDEFDGDLSKWNVRDRYLTFDRAEARAANVTIENGILHVRGKWLATPEARGPQGQITHTTGYIDTRRIGATDKLFSQRYGRWEIRAKMPAGPMTRGALSAFWLRADSHPGEIDIIERWGQGGTMPAYYDPYVKDTGWTTFHSDTMGSSAAGYMKTFWRHYQHGIPKDSVDTWHTYAFEYMPDYIAMFVDGKQVFRVTPTTMDPEVRTRTLAWLWDPRFFGSPLHMRLNLHVSPSAANWGLADRAYTQDPLDYQVDYVRVYAPQ
jgi:beta-glucanase (GH16 family)